jgi:hypothetical protein
MLRIAVENGSFVLEWNILSRMIFGHRGIKYNWLEGLARV